MNEITKVVEVRGEFYFQPDTSPVCGNGDGSTAAEPKFVATN